jgi:hypothetical protein
LLSCGGLAKARDDQVYKTICTACIVLQDLAFTTTPFFLANSHPELSTRSELKTSKDIDGRTSMEHYVPAICKFCPEFVQDVAEFRSV